jgi:hypothetical protein
MPVIDIGLRPSDHAVLKQLAAREGRRLQDQAAILLEDAIRHTRSLPAEASPPDRLATTPRPDSAA